MQVLKGKPFMLQFILVGKANTSYCQVGSLLEKFFHLHFNGTVLNNSGHGIISLQKRFRKKSATQLKLIMV